MDYTDRIDGYQIRDVIYFGKTPENAPIKFDVVKWVQTEPFEAYNMRTGKKETHTEYCYSVAFLEWDSHEPQFELHSVGLRWLEERPSEAVIEMVLQFCEEKGKELDYE